MNKLIKNINWKLLREQKSVLNEMRSENNYNTENHEKTALSGVVHLIDALQDLAVDNYGVDELTVFGKIKNLDHE